MNKRLMMGNLGGKPAADNQLAVVVPQVQNAAEAPVVPDDAVNE